MGLTAVSCGVSGQTEVGHLGVAVLVDKNICWLEIAVDYVKPVRRGNSFADAPKHGAYRLHRGRPL